MARARAQAEKVKTEKVKKDLELARIKQFKDKEDVITA